MQESKRRIMRLVLIAVLSLYAFQCLYAVIVTAIFALPAGRLAAFILIAAVYHGLIFVGSLVVRGEFNLDMTGERLKRINLPLYLSFIRFTSVPTLIFLFLSIKQINAAVALVPFLGFIFLTDLFDGLLARTFNQTTRIGRILDAVGDYLMILSLSVTYVLIGFIPLWLFIVVMVRLVVQAAGIITLYFLRGYSHLRLSLLGKASVFSIFSLYGIEVLEYLQVKGLGDPTVVSILELVAAGIVGVSLVEKVFLLIKSFTSAPGSETKSDH